MRKVAVAVAIVAVVVLLVWSGMHNARTRREEELKARLSKPTITVDKAGATATVEPGSGEGGPQADLRGKKAAIFTLTSTDGKRIALNDYKGKPVLLNFWATWCAPCKVEMPWFEEFSKKYAAQGLQVVGVNEDDEIDKKKLSEEIASTVQHLNVSYPILISDHKVGDAYGGLDMLPATFYIDRDGVIRAEAIGLASKDEAEANIQKILQAGS